MEYRMKIFLLSMLIIPITLLAGDASDKNPTDMKDGKQPETRIYEVFGMGCPGCESGICKLVKKIDGVQDVEASWKDKQLIVKVKPDQTLDDKKILDAIRKANFTPGKRVEQ